MRSLAIPIIAVYLALLVVPQAAIDSSLKTAIERCVLVETQTCKGTGIIVYSNLVLTNYHIIEDNSPVTVNGKPASVTMRDPRKDLALILTDTPAFPWIEFCDEPVTEEVFYVGHPMMHQTPFVVPGVIVGMEDVNYEKNHIKNVVYSTNQGLPGFSGSGLWCKKHGKLVGLEFATNGTRNNGYLFSMAIPAKEIKKFLRR